MKAIKATGVVKQDHSVLLQLPEDIQPGKHLFILVVDDADEHESSWPVGFLDRFAGSLEDTDLQAPEDPLPERLEA